MKSMIALVALVSTVFTGVSSQAQVRTNLTIQIDIEGVICALLPQDQQMECGRETVYSETNPAAVNLCQNLDFSSAKSQCYAQIRGRFYSSVALNMCSQYMFDSNKLECLTRIEDGYYQRGAISVCNSMDFETSKNQCLEKTKNRTFEQYEVTACKNEMFDSNKITCIENLGRDLRWSDRGYSQDNRRNNNSVIIIEESYPNYGRRDNNDRYDSRQEKCDIHNSNNTFLATINKKQLASYAAITARDSNSCVVTSILGESSSRTLFDRDGRVLGHNLTEDQARSMKHSRGMDRCHVLVCR